MYRFRADLTPYGIILGCLKIVAIQIASEGKVTRQINRATGRMEKSVLTSFFWTVNNVR